MTNKPTDPVVKQKCNGTYHGMGSAVYSTSCPCQLPKGHKGPCDRYYKPPERPTPLPQAAVERTTSDGYHTFNELYEHRHALFSVICKAFNGWKSKLHADGTMFDSWFIAGIQTAEGQATYHLPLSWWDRFQCREIDKAPEWDGHTPTDVVERIQLLAAAQSPEPSAASIPRCPKCGTEKISCRNGCTWEISQ